VTAFGKEDSGRIRCKSERSQKFKTLKMKPKTHADGELQGRKKRGHAVGHPPGGQQSSECS
jgi:hypothetical protein